MAFFGRIGNLLRHAANRQINSQISSELRATPSVFLAIRSMSSAPSSKLFIGGVSFSTDEQSLREAFSKYGEVVDARIIMDRETGRSRGFGFITYSSVEEASSAIQALDGQDLHGRRVRVNYANERTRGFGGGGGFGGSYGNSPYGAGAGTGYAGSYGGSPYGGGGYGGNAAGSYGGGGYGGNVAGGYGGGGYASGGSYGDSGSGMNYGNDGNLTSGNTYTGGSSGGYGGNSGNFGDAGGVGNLESSGGFADSDNYAASGGGSHGFTSSGYDGSAVDGSTGTSFTGGYDGSGGLDSKESSNRDGDLGDSLEGNYKDDDDDTDNFAKRA
ncbi:glycine-rich RNA-binding protein 3, mitochondrial-like [Abrus precatorius]|uniref:Glycine-rich RNA-binding protein 3, mitochondrial-like n=1 Tax=Abrus precatorius TaxID=3816 RepID=A0A8B8JHT7_ABRPR|nr:glycine-rich RNA-binding protein 3, mitochondrial-like [Abrus precatorius]